MSTFPFSNNNYSVEEISYEDLLSILSSQKQILSDSCSDVSNANDAGDICVLNKPLSKHDKFTRRIADNANQQLPDWLLNN